MSEQIDALGVVDGYLINLLDAAGTNLVSQKLRFPREFENLEKTYVGYKNSVDDGHFNARAFQQRQVVRIHPQDAPAQEKVVLDYWKCDEFVGVPIIDPGKADAPALGVILLLRQQGSMTDRAIGQVQEILGLFYNSLRNWLRHAHLEEIHDRAKAAVEENRRLLAFLDEMSSLTSADQVYELFAAESFRQLGFDIAGFALLENQRMVTRKIVAADPRFDPIALQLTQHLQQNPYPLDVNVSGAVNVLMRDEALVFPDLQQISHLPMTEHDTRTIAILQTARTLFISPIRYQKKPIGIFAMYSLTKPLALAEADLNLFDQLASFLGTAITNSQTYAMSQAQNLEIGHLNVMLQEKVKELAEQASTDRLTGLYNFRTYEQEIAKRVKECHRVSGKHELSLALIDIDHFKRFNDTHGHGAGNDILAGVAGELGKLIRQTDMAFRYGGEEFVIILPKCDLAGAVLLADRIRAAIEARAFKTCAGRHTVTVSIGCTMYQPDDTQHSLFTRADKALYQAKHDGRNQVCSI